MEQKNHYPHTDEENSQSGKPIDLFSDSDYLKLVDCFQHAEFGLCQQLLIQLEKSYPGHPSLVEFKDDLDLRLSLQTMSASIEEGVKRKKKKTIINKSIFAVVSLIVVIVAFFISFYFMNRKAIARQSEIEKDQLITLNNQAERLLIAGQPKLVGEIIERIKAIDPEYENLPQLLSQWDNLSQLESKYRNALDLAAEDKKDEALQILKEVESEQPGLWDVTKQIATIETSFQIIEYLEQGNTAFRAGNWDQVINAYENAMLLDPGLDDPVIKEQFFQGYLNKIISMLENENTSIEDIEHAEEYYRKAIALAPQNPAFAGERVNLQKVSSGLLELKYSQMARAFLQDPNQTVSTIAKAISYLRKAVNMSPDNSSLQTDLVNTEYYQIGFNNFIENKWELAVTNFELIKAVDSNFANGNVDLLLFEAYHALAKQYFSLGLYLDAIRILEQAEILAWEDSDNLMKLFQVQAFMGEAYGKIGDFKNSVSYYKYAFDAVQAYNKLRANNPTLANKLNEANIFEAYADYENAFIAYEEVLADIEEMFSISEIAIDDGVCLAFFANTNLSTIDAVMEANNLQKNMVITFGRILKVPIIEK